MGEKFFYINLPGKPYHKLAAIRLNDKYGTDRYMCEDGQGRILYIDELIPASYKEQVRSLFEDEFAIKEKFFYISLPGKPYHKLGAIRLSDKYGTDRYMCEDGQERVLHVDEVVPASDKDLVKKLFDQ